MNMPKGMSHADMQAKIATDLIASGYTSLSPDDGKTYATPQISIVGATLKDNLSQEKSMLYAIPHVIPNLDWISIALIPMLPGHSPSWTYSETSSMDQGHSTPPRKFTILWDNIVEATELKYNRDTGLFTCRFDTIPSPAALQVLIKPDKAKRPLSNRWPLAPALPLADLPPKPPIPWPPDVEKPAGYYWISIWPK
jgi:hypothetical protein